MLRGPMARSFFASPGSKNIFKRLLLEGLAGIMNVLFVCTANISRSFLAEKLMKHAVKARDLNHVFTRSAGVYAEPGRPPDPKMVKYLVENHKKTSQEQGYIRWR